MRERAGRSCDHSPDRASRPLLFWSERLPCTEAPGILDQNDTVGVRGNSARSALTSIVLLLEVPPATRTRSTKQRSRPRFGPWDATSNSFLQISGRRDRYACAMDKLDFRSGIVNTRPSGLARP
jgi:hypothetical protein